MKRRRHSFRISNTETVNLTRRQPALHPGLYPPRRNIPPFPVYIFKASHISLGYQQTPLQHPTFTMPDAPNGLELVPGPRQLRTDIKPYVPNQGETFEASPPFLT